MGTWKWKDVWFKLVCWLYGHFGKDITCMCGHIAKRKTYLPINEKSGVYTLSRDANYCPTCFARAAIVCASCGKTILPGEPIMLVMPAEDRTALPKTTKLLTLESGEKANVLCLRTGCGEPALRNGFWEMPGRVRRVVSPIEQAAMTKEIVIVGNISDPREALSISQT